MPVCDVCGNDYDKAFEVTMGSRTHTFDSFECAIHALAPTCATCGVRIVGHASRKAIGSSVAATAPSARA
jgi:hypothetical protein